MRVFWASHVVHHSSRHYNLSTALRQTWIPMTALPFWAPLALLGGAMALTRRLDVGRVLVGTALAIVVVFAVNLLRIVIIAVATSTYGFDGYEVSHRIIGSAVTVVGACVAFIVTFRVVAQAAGAHRADR